jgi:hypothetical protein
LTKIKNPIKMSSQKIENNNEAIYIEKGEIGIIKLNRPKCKIFYLK